MSPKELKSSTNIETGKDGLILIEATDVDPPRAAAMANGFAEELDKLLQAIAHRDAKNQLTFLEQERSQTLTNLSKAEEELRKFSEKTGVIQIESQTRGMITYIAMLRAEMDAKEVQIQVLKKRATPMNFDVVRLETEVNGLRDKLKEAERKADQAYSGDVLLATSKVPGLGLEFIRLFREMKYHGHPLPVLLQTGGAGAPGRRQERRGGPGPIRGPGHAPPEKVMLRLDDGKLVVSGLVYSVVLNSEFYIARFLPNGTPDPSFGNNGSYIGSYGSDEEYCEAMTMQPDGKFILAGRTYAGSFSQLLLMRVNANGTLDASFGTNGYTEINASIQDEQISALQIMDNGQIVGVGYGYQGNPMWGEQVFMAKLTPTGQPVAGFGTNGVIIPPIFTPFSVSVSFVSQLYERELKLLSRDKNVPSVLRRRAQEVLHEIHEK